MKYAFVFAALLSFAAFATDKNPAPPPAPTSVSNADATSNATSESVSTASANNAGVNAAAAMQVDFEDRRQAPALAQGSQYLVGCGMSVNGGLSNPGDAGFLGFSWITPYCRDQAQIANEAAFGNVKTACEMNRLTPAGQRNLKRLTDAGLTAEPCPGAVPAVEPKPTVVVLTGESCADNRERTDRAFEKCAGK